MTQFAFENQPDEVKNLVRRMAKNVIETSGQGATMRKLMEVLQNLLDPALQTGHIDVQYDFLTQTVVVSSDAPSLQAGIRGFGPEEFVDIRTIAEGNPEETKRANRDKWGERLTAIASEPGTYRMDSVGCGEHVTIYGGTMHKESFSSKESGSMTRTLRFPKETENLTSKIIALLHCLEQPPVVTFNKQQIDYMDFVGKAVDTVLSDFNGEGLTRSTGKPFTVSIVR